MYPKSGSVAYVANNTLFPLGTLHSVHTMGYVVADGKSNWLEGVILICAYIRIV